MEMHSTRMHHIPSVPNEIIAAPHHFAYIKKAAKNYHEVCPTEGVNEALKEPEFARI